MQPNRLRQLAIAAVLAAGVVIVAVIVSQGGSDDGGGPADDTAAVEELFAGIPQRETSLGDPRARATMVEFADLQCPFCRDFTLDVLPELIDRYVRSGDVRLDLQLIAIIGEDSAEAARVAAAAALQDRMWQFTDLFYRNQGTEESGYVTEDFLREIAEATPGLDADAALADADSPQAQRILARADTEASRFGVESTPSFLLGASGSVPEPLSVGSLEVGSFSEPIERAIDG
jgi:protein-disulfide isomerase